MAVVLSPLSCELLTRMHKRLGGSVFGQSIQKIIMACLELNVVRREGVFTPNPGAGVPDCHANVPGESGGLYSWEIKYTPSTKVELSERDIKGVLDHENDVRARPRLIVLTTEYPPRLAVVDGSGLQVGEHRLPALSEAEIAEETEELARAMDCFLRIADGVLLQDDCDVAQAVKETSEMLGQRTGIADQDS